MNPVLDPASPARPPRRASRRPRHRRLILVLAVVAILETAGASLSAVALATGQGRQATATTGASTGTTGGSAPASFTDAGGDAPTRDTAMVRRPPRPERLLAAEQSGRQAPAAATTTTPTDQATAPGAQEGAADQTPAQPSPADAGDETAAAAGGLAGAGRVAAAVPQRLRIPELGINQSIRQFPCDRPQPPNNYVYQWGCAGRNNLYLLGHAYSVFEPLHDAYAAGRLHVGMTASFTGTDGKVTTYRVTTWRVVRPDQVSWAIAPQSTPSMTLQTCFGADSEYRLLVRLVAGG